MTPRADKTAVRPRPRDRTASSRLIAGAAVADITPRDSPFLFGYPHVRRGSTGVHDPLLSSALYLSDGATPVLFVANDIIFVSREIAGRVRDRIAASVPVPAAHIMITATHTHSGPVTVNYLSNEGDPVVPRADPAYVRLLEDGIAAAAGEAFRRAEPAEAGLVIADGRAVGTNRRDPAGPADPDVPVLLVRSADGRRHLACMLICSMHPTVLHEDSTLVSADFPGFTRQHLQGALLGAECPVLHHTGPSGNQSPRHVTRANTFEEARRLGEALGRNVLAALRSASFARDLPLRARQAFLPDLPRQHFPPVADAGQKLKTTRERLGRLRREKAPAAQVRTAECDWFGAEETVTLARAEREGRTGPAAASCLPAEIQVLGVGRWNFVGWPCEIFAEYALAVKRAAGNTWGISLANGELQGYIVTPEAAAEGGYEASNALFAADSGRRLVEKTLAMLESAGA